MRSRAGGSEAQCTAQPAVPVRATSGIQADIKTCEALGAFATTAIVALTAQNTLGVHGVHEVPVDFVVAQVLSYGMGILLVSNPSVGI